MLAILDNGEEYVFSKVGMEPTGDPFNSIVKLETSRGRKPYNPMINAGAIAVSSMIKGKDAREKFERLLDFFKLISEDSTLDVNYKIYCGEAETGNRNRAMGYFLKSEGIIDGNVEDALTVYFKQCSIEVTAETLSKIALFLVNNGKISTGETIIPPRVATIIKTLMVTCGMYDSSGEFAIRVGTIVNIVLDPIFILTLGMGTAGAAIATVIGNIAGTLYYIYYFNYRSPLLTISPRYFTFSQEVAGSLLKLGIPAGINSGLMSISTIFLNNILLIYGNSAVAAMGIVTKIYLLIALIHMGIANGIQPLLGYCYGAKLKKRFMDIMKFSLKFSISIGLILTVIYIVFSKEIIELFIQDREVIEYGAKMLVATSLAGPILGVMFLSINGMQAINNPLPATVLSLARQGLLFIPLLFVMNSFLGLTGVNFTQTVADYISIVIGVFLFINSLKKVKE
jgi:putative MATE family efflux protein